MKVFICSSSGEEVADLISDRYYNYFDQILSGLWKKYSGGGEFTRNIDDAGGEGSSAFANEVIQVYCDRTTR